MSLTPAVTCTQTEPMAWLHGKAFELTAEGIAITDAQGRILQVNPAFHEITGYDPQELIGRELNMLQRLREDSAFPAAGAATIFDALGEGEIWRGQVWSRRKNGEVFPEWLTLSRVQDARGQMVNFVAVLRGLSHSRSEADLDRLKRYDVLTGLPNRLLLEDRTSEAIVHARQSQRRLALLFVNLDNFHLVNDLFGYDQGDEVLRQTAKRLVATVADRGTVSRLSGDTFVVLLPELEQAGEVNGLVASLLCNLAESMTLAGQAVNLTSSIGIALWPEDGERFDVLMQSADVAMASARSLGPNSCSYFTRDMNRAAQKLFSLSAEIRAALAESRLRLHFQPLVALASGRVAGVEALVRIQRADGSMLSPAEFIPVAEETGLIVEVGEWVIRAACRQIRLWIDAGMVEMTLSINLSPRQLRQPNLVAFVADALAETGVKPALLELEFVESAIGQDAGSLLQVLRQLKQLGVRLVIDNFGTGCSSLSYLKQFPIDKMKIDRTFIRNLTVDPGDASIVQAIIAMARTLGPATLAEGVETEAQFNYLRSLRCDQIQGYYFSPPIEAEAVPALFEKHCAPARQDARPAILLVDDEESVLNALKRLLRRENYTIFTASSAERGLEILAREQVEVVLSDQRMPVMSGVEFLRRVKTIHPRVVRMILSGYTDVNTITEAINGGEVYKFMNKPWENEALVGAIREAFARYDDQQRSAVDAGGPG